MVLTDVTLALIIWLIMSKTGFLGATIGRLVTV